MIRLRHVAAWLGRAILASMRNAEAFALVDAMWRDVQGADYERARRWAAADAVAAECSFNARELYEVLKAANRLTTDWLRALVARAYTMGLSPMDQWRHEEGK